jgi:hypothetical protein
MTTTEAPSIEKLTEAFKNARLAALLVDEPKRDGGSCNLDFVVLGISTRYKKRVLTAAEEAGVDVRTGYAHGRQRLIMDVPQTHGGQADNRTRIAEAVCKSLNNDGIDAYVYYLVR